MKNTDGVPVHVAIIPDGNRRWAKQRNLPTLEGHKRGYENMIALTKKAREMGIKIMTMWGFSTENWNRTQDEVGYLMKLFEGWVESYIKDALQNEVRITHLGRKDRLNKTLLNKITKAEDQTKKFDKYFLNIALDYGGRDEIIRAVKKILEKSKDEEEITKERFSEFLDTGSMSDPDLIIRTGGEKRISGFLIWQSDYAEYAFAEEYFPDFQPINFEKVIEDYKNRHRRFGK